MTATAHQKGSFVVVHKRLGEYLCPGRTISPTLAKALRFPTYAEAEDRRLDLDSFRDAYEVRRVD